MNEKSILIIIGLVVVFFLITQRWFWKLVFGLSTLASFFAMCASVIHFKIIGAVGFFILTAILAGILSELSGSNY